MLSTLKQGLWVCALLLQAAIASAQGNAPRTRLCASAGLGFINLEDRGMGIDIPLGFVLLADQYRLIGAAQLLDLALMQRQESENPRFIRDPYSAACFDTLTGYLVSGLRCAGDTDLLLSLGVDLSYVPVETSFIGGRPGKLAVGLGYRLQHPRTAYGTLGMFFDSPGGGGGFKVALGRRYVYFGINWAFQPRRLIGRR